MVGTHPTTMGGVSTVVRGYMDGGLFQRFDCHYVATHRDGGALTKATTALRAWLSILVQLIWRPTPLVHIHLSSRASFWRKSVVCLMARALHRPYVLHMHGSEFMKFYDDECGPRARHFVQGRFRDAALVLALSEEWRANLLRICPTAKVEVLTNAVALPDLSARRASNDTDLTILFLGRLGERKGTFDLVNAFGQLASRFPKARLICAGDGAIKEVQQLTRDLGIESRVTCPGWLSVAEARQLLSSASVFTLPSYAEGLPMALLEAMSWSLPVVTSPVGGIPQVIRDGQNGFLVAPGDVGNLSTALASLLESATLRQRIGEAARRTIEQTYSLDASLDRLGAIYGRFGVPPRIAAAH